MSIEDALGRPRGVWAVPVFIAAFFYILFTGGFWRKR